MGNLSQQLKNLSPEQRSLLEAKLKEKGIQISQSDLGKAESQSDKPNGMASLRISPRNQDANIPLSFAQKRLWFVQQLEPENNSYNVPCVLKLEGKLNIEALQKALNEIVKRHEILRTVFVANENKEPIQVVREFEEFELEVRSQFEHSLAPVLKDTAPHIGGAGSRKKSALKDTASHRVRSKEYIIDEIFKKPFDLGENLLRIKLLKLADNSYLLIIATHHIVSDRWSIGVFLKEIAILYRAYSQQQDLPLSPLPIQYGDYAIWQRNRLKDKRLEKQIDYWQEKLQDISVLELPCDHTRLPVPSYQGAKYPLVLNKDLSDRINAFSNQTGVTLFTLLLTAFKVLLYRYSQQEDIVVGTDIANRDRTETEGLIGLLVNTLVLRTDLTGNPSFTELLNRVKQVTLDAFAHQDLPFEKLVEVLNPERDLSQMMPLFQVKFDLQLAEVKPLTLPNLKVERLPLEESTVKYELRFNLQNNETGINGYVEYSTDLFNESTIARMVEHFIVLLEGIANNPESKIAYLPLITSKEKAIIDRANNTEKNYPQNNSIIELFTTQAAKTPDAIAVIYLDKKLTYQELNEKSDRLAEYLQSLGVKPEVKVGICVERSLDMIIGMLAILKAGGCYVPLDPNYPQERLDYIVRDSEIEILLTQTEYKSNFDDENITLVDLKGECHSPLYAERYPLGQHPCTPAPLHLRPENLAYIIYTSGSTGKPKGVAIAHKNALQLLHWAKEVFTPEELSGVLAATSICFDLSIFEIFVPLSWGGKAILAENALELPNLPNKNEVKLINTVPSAISSLLQTDNIPESVITVNLAGESLKTELVGKLYQKEHIKNVYNLYGPSEDTTYSTYARVENDERVSATIGKPVANTKAYVLDKYLQQVPIGVPGELYLASNKIARGYLNKPELTAENFIPNPVGTFHETPLHDARLYKTGDLVKYLPTLKDTASHNGDLEFLGRIDRQIKIRGYRLEIDEVETVLNSHPEVKESVVIAKQENDLSQSLIAYIITNTVGANGHSPSLELRAFLTKKLPSYAIPSAFIELEDFPLLPNGKINRKALLELDNFSPQETAAHTAPQTDTEKIIAGIWQQELNLDRVGIDDNFFELGGHSLLGIKIVSYISEALEKNIALKKLFQYPTIRELAAQIENAAKISNIALPKIIANPKDKYTPFPLTDIQQAYLIGRSDAFALGNVATHGYREIETVGVSIDEVETAWNKLIQRHEMLRMVVTEDGKQRILNDVPEYKIKRSPLAPLNKGGTRERLSHQIISLDTFPLFEIEAIQLEEDRVRFCISFDVLIGDAWSFRILAQEMVQLLLNPELELPKLDLSFRDYVLAEQKLRESKLYHSSWDYWQQRIPNLSPAPELPLVKNLESINKPHFKRRSYTLSRELWQNIKQRATKEKITPSGLLLAAFSEVLTAWSTNPHFTINLTLFNRLPLHSDVDRIVGDFTSSTLLEVDNRGQDSFINRCSKIQAQLWQDLDNRYVSGIEILRELARNKQQIKGALMPVVFTSTLTQEDNSSNKNNLPWQAETVYSVSQTSQVYLDHQVGEIDGELILNWDAIDELFPDRLLDDMFGAYCGFIEQLAIEDRGQKAALKDTASHKGRREDLTTTMWDNICRDLLPSYQKELFTKVNVTEFDFQAEDLKLQDLFFDRVKDNPEQIAIIDKEFTFTYKKISDRVNQLADTLQQQIKSDSDTNIIAVVLEKGWEQIVAVLGILTASAAYVPIDPSLPRDRALHILSATNAQCIVTTEELANNLEWINKKAEGLNNTTLHIENLLIVTHYPLPITQNKPVTHYPLPITHVSNLAYIIYTSGSTGIPKGVAISHQGAVNTILDINRRFAVDSNDKILALSSLSFDLSVYDIFGILAAGGTVIIPPADAVKDAVVWRKLIQEHQITIWNSVPALMEMLVEDKNINNSSLRLVMLSGDWINLGLRDRIKNNYPDARVFSLGGATEASIWSIFYPIEAVDKSWTSIPYGKPLANQYFQVLNNNLDPCPLWVSGDLYIGGQGLAECYWGDNEKTNSSFITHSQTKKRLYKTGDKGRYLPNGNIEFLGREDFQVKVNGYRIELGEIEATLQQHPQIEKVLVSAVGDSNKQLVAYLVPKQNSNSYSPLDKIEFKLEQKGIRKITEDETEIGLSLPEADDRDRFLSRQSYRQFLQQEIALDKFSSFLSCLRQIQVANSSLPKYRYGSAGSLYPVQTYVYLKPNSISGLDGGYYYYHPQKHSLVAVSKYKEINSYNYGVNQSIFEQSNFSIFLIGELNAIAPIYKDSARDFCLLEAGYISQLLMDIAPDYNLGLCPIGKLESDFLKDNLKLQSSHILLHSFVGGSIDPEWTKQWQQTNQSQPTISIKDSLQKYLKQKLPDYMIPSNYIILEKFPLTSNGKIDRRALPIPNFNQNKTKYVAPRNETEIQIVNIWQENLELEKIGINDNFFDLGGNSLSATQVCDLIRNAFNIELTIRQFFTTPTVAEIAKMVINSQTIETKADSSPQIEKVSRESAIDLDNLSESEIDGLLQQMLVDD
ncbi:MAG: amino acid adenylation domain-containing protein [Cyanobacteria bacterium P01_G01_bin.67]